MDGDKMKKTFAIYNNKYTITHNEPETFMDSIVDEIVNVGHYKIDEQLPPNPVIVDLGAHVGIASLYFKSMYPTAQIYAVEMNPQTYACLKENVELYGIKTYQTAVSSVYVDRPYFDTGDNNSAMSIIGGKRELGKVASTTLERFMQEEKIDHIDLLKIDVEGAEFEIFLTPGFTNVASKISLITGEIHREFYVIPLILKRMGFNFQYKNINNLNMKYVVKHGDGSFISEYEVDLNTLFIAKHI